MNGKNTRQEDSRRVFYKETRRESRRNPMEVLFFILAVLCLVYYVSVILFSGPGTSFAWFWIAAGIVFFIFFLYWRICRKDPGRLPVWGKGLILSLLAAGFLVFALLLFQVLGSIHRTAPDDLPYVIVLGAKVKGDRPSRALRKRLETALSYAEQNPSSILILSGGQGPDEKVSEAQCMKEWLLQNGFPAERMILEDASTDTRENLIFSDEKSGCKTGPVGIVTNDFHVYRALRLAEGLGYTKACGIAAPTEPVIVEPHYLVREVFALVKEILTGNISL